MTNPPRVQSLGHLVLRVRRLDVSVPFYRDVLGLKEVARYGRSMAFFSCGEKHHDLGLQEIGSTARNHGVSVGLYHVAFKVGDSLEDLRRFKAHLEKHGVPILGQSDHRVSQSLYLTDPDGIEIEVFVDADPAVWKTNPAAVATIEPLNLDS